MRRSVCLLVLVAACGGDSGFVYQGTAGIPVPAAFDGVVPAVVIHVDGSAGMPVILDTGSPLTILDSSAFTALTVGKHDVVIDAFGLTFPDYPVVAFDLFGDSDQGAAGLAGGDLFRHFGYTLDYKGERVWLSDPFDPAALPGDVAVEPEVTLPLDLRGGGNGSLPGCPACGTIVFQPTRVIIKLTLEGQAEPVWALLDTGASAVVLDEALFTELGDQPPRPRLPVNLGTPSGDQEAFLSRVWRARALGVSGDGAVSLDNMPVLVVPGSTIFASISAETGLPVRALLGGAYMRAFLTTIDYPQKLVRFARYQNESHIDPNEFVGVGFDLAQRGSNWQVNDVIPGSDAEAQGLAVGEIVDQLGTMPISGQSASVVNRVLAAYSVGERVPVGVRRGGEVVMLDILVEDLLPHYPPP